MITHLSIKNYILIDFLEIPFGEGLTTITGETGAGKSILLGAMDLILGERADKNVLLDKERKCIIEGTFSIKGYNLEKLFAEFDLDYEEQSIIRRELLPSGKSRAFVNDTPVKLHVLKALGNKLINIHSQFETLTLSRSDFHMTVLDDFAHNQPLVQKYSNAFEVYIKSKKHLTELQDKEKNARAEQDYYKFLFEELENAKLEPDEKEKLEEEYSQLTHTEDIRQALYFSVEALSRSEQSIIESLKEINLKLFEVSGYHQQIKAIQKRVDSSYIELEDIAAELENLEADIEYNPHQLEFIQQRLDIIYALEQKHQVEGTEALLQLKDKFDKKLQDIETLEEDIDNQKSTVRKHKAEAEKLAIELHQKRANKAPEVADAVQNVLGDLNMSDSRVVVDVQKKESLNESGMSDVEILFSANKGHKPGPIKNVASGGELSRLMLAIKSILSAKNILPTIIFDEIDSGVSGNAAVKVGQIMHKMSQTMQVIAITHLPQIAAKGKDHWKVYKYEKNGRSQTNIKKLTRKERVEETALMISGEYQNKNALKTAKQLIG